MKPGTYTILSVSPWRIAAQIADSRIAWRSTRHLTSREASSVKGVFEVPWR